MFKKVLTIMFFSVFLQAQTSFYGYFESEIDWLTTSDVQYSFNYNKIRMDFESRPTENLLVAGNMNGYYYSGQSTLNLLDFIPEKIWIPVLAPDYNPDSTHITSLPFSFSDSLYIDNIYLRANFKYLDITIGRQPVSLGTGYAWNPLDIFNRKDIIDPTYEQPQVTALRLEIPVSNLFSYDAIYSPEDNINGDRIMLQVKSNIAGFDFTLNVASARSLIPSWKMRDLGHTHWKSRFYGGSFSGQIFGAGVWAEAIYSEPLHFELLEYVTGTDYTFSNGLYIFGEFYHNPLGSDGEDISYIHYLNSFTGESHSLMQDYFMNIISYPVTDFVNPSLLAVFNLNDKSILFAPQITWEILENLQMMVWYAVPSGGKDSEFGIQKEMIRIRLKAYF